MTPISTTDRTVKVEMFSRMMATVELIWMFLNGDRKEIVNSGGFPVKRLERKVKLHRFVGQPDCWEAERAIAGLGGLPVYYGKCVFTIQESMRAMSRYSGIQASPICMGSTEVLSHDVLYIERLNHDLAIGVDPVRCYGFLPSKEQITQQINVIDRNMQLGDDNSDTCADGLLNAFHSLLGGYDTIYMADDMESL